MNTVMNFRFPQEVGHFLSAFSKVDTKENVHCIWEVPQLESQPVHDPSWLKLYVVLLSPSQTNSGTVLLLAIAASSYILSNVLLTYHPTIWCYTVQNAESAVT
jgi:hypothetical protein